MPLPDTDQDPWIQSLNAARQLALLDVPALVLDTDSGFIRLDRAQELARALGSEYLPLDELTAESLTLVIQEHRRSAGQALEIGIFRSMIARTLMIQGTSSSVGKSLLVAALCRIFARRGVRIAPFKAQNMSNNAAVCGDGSEIGRSQQLQAAAAGIEPTADMNPILLKPTADAHSQVIVSGRPWRTQEARVISPHATSSGRSWSQPSSGCGRRMNL